MVGGGKAVGDTKLHWTVKDDSTNHAFQKPFEGLSHSRLNNISDTS